MKLKRTPAPHPLPAAPVPRLNQSGNPRQRCYQGDTSASIRNLVEKFAMNLLACACVGVLLFVVPFLECIPNWLFESKCILTTEHDNATDTKLEAGATREIHMVRRFCIVGLRCIVSVESSLSIVSVNGGELIANLTLSPRRRWLPRQMPLGGNPLRLPRNICNSPLAPACSLKTIRPRADTKLKQGARKIVSNHASDWGVARGMRVGGLPGSRWKKLSVDCAERGTIFIHVKRCEGPCPSQPNGSAALFFMYLHTLFVRITVSVHVKHNFKLHAVQLAVQLAPFWFRRNYRHIITAPMASHTLPSRGWGRQQRALRVTHSAPTGTHTTFYSAATQSFASGSPAYKACRAYSQAAPGTLAQSFSSRRTSAPLFRPQTAPTGRSFCSIAATH